MKEIVHLKNGGACVKKVLLTGFDPFGNESVNPAIEAVKKLEGKVLEGYTVEVLEVSTAFDSCIEELKLALKAVKPDVVICVGQAGGRSQMCLERVAINVNDARIADNEGNQPIDTPVVEDGPVGYWSTLPIKAIVEALRNQGIPASVSQTAGTFVCNHIFYGLMHQIKQMDRDVRGGFIHIPFLPEQAAKHPGQPSMALETIVQGLEYAIVTSINYKQDISVVGGQVS